jgi:hypothetical protein
MLLKPPTIIQTNIVAHNIESLKLESTIARTFNFKNKLLRKEISKSSKPLIIGLQSARLNFFVPFEMSRKVFSSS